MRLIAVICFSFLRSAYSRNDDLFNYRETDGNDYGPEDWDQVTCDDVTVCVSVTNHGATGMMLADRRLNLFPFRLDGQTIGCSVSVGNSKRTPANGVLRAPTDVEHTINRLSISSAIERLKTTPCSINALTSTG
jgi:hypothetical protein